MNFKEGGKHRLRHAVKAMPKTITFIVCTVLVKTCATHSNVVSFYFIGQNGSTKGYPDPITATAKMQKQDIVSVLGRTVRSHTSKSLMFVSSL